MAYIVAWQDTSGCGGGVSPLSHQTPEAARAEAEHDAGGPLDWRQSHGEWIAHTRPLTYTVRRVERN